MNFATNSLWFEIALLSSLYALGQIFFANFAMQTPKWRRAIKFIFFTVLACVLSGLFGRVWFFVVFGFLLGALIVIHAWWLPKHGINGLTGEPKEKYYALRGWQTKQ
jgi:hypothetical protein